MFFRVSGRSLNPRSIRCKPSESQWVVLVIMFHTAAWMFHLSYLSLCVFFFTEESTLHDACQWLKGPVISANDTKKRLSCLTKALWANMSWWVTCHFSVNQVICKNKFCWMQCIQGPCSHLAPIIFKLVIFLLQDFINLWRYLSIKQTQVKRLCSTRFCIMGSKKLGSIACCLFACLPVCLSINPYLTLPYIIISYLAIP